MNQGSNFLVGSFSNKDNVRAPIQFRRESQPQHLKRWLFIENRTIECFHVWTALKQVGITILVDRFDAVLQIDENGLEINFDPDSYKPIDIWYDDKTKRLSSSSYKYPKQGKGNEGEQNTDIATSTLSDLEEEDRDREQETLLFTDV